MYRDTSPLTFIDLFAGVGGLASGFLNARLSGSALFRPLCLVDKDAVAAYTFQRNFPNVPYVVKDIDRLGGCGIRAAARLNDTTRPHVLIGGPPCQGFTILRKNKHLDDPRNALMRGFLAAVEELQPLFVLIENVKNILYCVSLSG